MAIASSRSESIRLSRYTATGALDTDFRTEGVATAGAGRNASTVAAQADGRTVVGDTAGSGLGMARFTALVVSEADYGVVLNRAGQA